MADHGFDIVSRSRWGARQPRSRTTRSAGTVNTIYLHWPGTAGHLAQAGSRIEIPTLGELLEITKQHRDSELADLPAVLRALRVPEDEADDCLLPPDLLPGQFFGSRSGRIDTAAEERAYMREIQRFHMDVRGWSDFAYNYMIFRSRRIYAGRTFKVVPASQAPFNTTGVSFCCAIGTADTISAAMKQTLREVVPWSEDYARRELRARGHRDVNPTSCPGDRLHAYTRVLDRL